MTVQWFPGHMVKSKRLIIESLSLVDIVIELLDARIPLSSRNPDIDRLSANKSKIIVLNKADLANESVTKEWEKYYTDKGYHVVCANSQKGNGLNAISTLVTRLMKDKREKQLEKGRIFVPAKAMIVGIPNVGKSTLINKCVGTMIAKTGDRPGVTRSNQWIRIKKDFLLLDTPGLLWPKFEDERVGIMLAVTGAVKDDIMDMTALSLKLIILLKGIQAEAIKKRYKIEFADDEQEAAILERIGKARGFIKKGGAVDIERTAIIMIDEFRSGALGKITLELPELSR